MRAVARLLAIGLLAGTAVTTGATDALAADSAQAPLVEDYAYPGADQILADRGLRLYRGDGRITLVDCPTKGTADDKVIRAKSTSQGEYCFKVTAPSGYLSLELPETFKIRGDGDHTVEAKVSTQGKEETVAVNKTRDTPVGEGINYDKGPAVLLELRATGSTPAPTGQNTSTSPVAKITIGASGYPGSRACTGALIAPQWIATASSCFADDPAKGFTVAAGAPKQKTTVTLGRADLAEADKGQVRDVTTLIPRNDRDLVLAKLAAPVTGITPLPLGSTTAAADKALHVAGYGRTATEWVPTQPHRAAVAATADTDTTLTVTPADGAAPCKGDAGGPVYRDLGNNRSELVAITSSGSQKGCLGTPQTTTQIATMARTDNIANWIKGQIPALSITCTASVPIFAVKDDMLLYGHPDPVSGGGMSPNQSVIGKGGWSSFARVLAGPNGTIYGIRAGGDVYRYQWTGTAWSDNSREIIATGWWGWDNPATRPKLTIDARGDFYSTGTDGILWKMTYTESTKTWNTVKVDTGWDTYNLITAAGDGVLYARTHNGQLYRFAYDNTAGRWAQNKKLVGDGGWGIYKSLSSAGGDVLYGVTTGGDLRWYRYSSYIDTWAEGPTTIGNGGWQQFTHVTVQSNACKLPN